MWVIFKNHLKEWSAIILIFSLPILILLIFFGFLTILEAFPVWFAVLFGIGLVLAIDKHNQK